MTISTKTFQNLQPGVSAADDLRVRTPINQALQWLGEGLPNELNAEFASISASLSNINSALAQISQSVSVQIAAAISVYASSRPTFRAHKNGTNQASISATNTPITFGTEDWDVGSYFASNVWTPPNGRYRLTVSLTWTTANAVDNERLQTALQLGGLNTLVAHHSRAGTIQQTFVDSFLVSVDGSTTVGVAALKSGAGDGELSGNLSLTWFCGEAII
jgi:hypothetical protein